MKKCSWCNTDAGLLALRIGVGSIFIMTGWMKASSMSMTIGFFASLGFAAFWTYLVTAVELFGGIAILLGIYTRVAAGLLAIVMIVAAVVVYKDVTTVFAPVSLLFSSIALVLAGGGAYSLMRTLCGCGTCGACADSDVVSSAK